MSEFKPLVFSGVQPTGNLHLGNYLGAIRKFVALQESHDCIYCVVDLHSITAQLVHDDLPGQTRSITAAFLAAGIDPTKMREKSEMEVLPRAVRQVADNYNHLHEQPVIFYALVFYGHLAGVADGLDIMLAWSYVALRIVHSLWQGLVNFIPVRFALFVLASLVLIVMAVRDLAALAV